MTQLLLVISLVVITAVVLVVVGYLVAIIIALLGAIKNLSQLAGGLIAISSSLSPTRHRSAKPEVAMFSLEESF